MMMMMMAVFLYFFLICALDVGFLLGLLWGAGGADLFFGFLTAVGALPPAVCARFTEAFRPLLTAPCPILY